MDSVKMREAVEAGKTILGIEFGSTRIKAVLTNEENTPIAQGAHDWENRLENGIWTYTLEDIWSGLQDAYAKLAVRCQPEKNWCNRIFSNDARLHGI
jgi:sugar (pentulose or hexulose) kinase